MPFSLYTDAIPRPRTVIIWQTAFLQTPTSHRLFSPRFSLGQPSVFHKWPPVDTCRRLRMNFTFAHTRPRSYNNADCCVPNQFKARCNERYVCNEFRSEFRTPDTRRSKLNRVCLLKLCFKRELSESVSCKLEKKIVFIRRRYVLTARIKRLPTRFRSNCGKSAFVASISYLICLTELFTGLFIFHAYAYTYIKKNSMRVFCPDNVWRN